MARFFKMNKNRVDRKNEIKILTNVSEIGIAKPSLNKIDLFRVYPIQMTAAFVILFILSTIVIGSIIGVVFLKNKPKQFEQFSLNSSGIPELSPKLSQVITTNRPSNKSSSFRVFRVNSTENGFARIYVHSAKVPDSDSTPREKESDPFVTITIRYYTNNTFHEKTYSYENRVMRNANHPIFNINCRTLSVPLVNSTLIFRLYDKDEEEYDNKSTNDLISPEIKVSILNDVIKMNKTKTPLILDIFGKNDQLIPQYYLNVTIWWTFDTILVSRRIN